MLLQRLPHASLTPQKQSTFSCFFHASSSPRKQGSVSVMFQKQRPLSRFRITSQKAGLPPPDISQTENCRFLELSERRLGRISITLPERNTGRRDDFSTKKRTLCGFSVSMDQRIADTSRTAKSWNPVVLPVGLHPFL